MDKYAFRLYEAGYRPYLVTGVFKDGETGLASDWMKPDEVKNIGSVYPGVFNRLLDAKPDYAELPERLW